MTDRAHVCGVGFWAVGYPNAACWLSGRRDDTAREPPADCVNVRLKRGTSLVTRMLVEVASQATAAAGFDGSQVATIFGSVSGEIQIAIAQLDMMRDGDGTVSPARFKNSVHNTAAGIFSIAHDNHGFTTALAGDEDTLAMCLIEAFGLLHAGSEEVVVAVGDEALPRPLDRFYDYRPLAVGFALSRSPRPNARGRIGLPRPLDPSETGAAVSAGDEISCMPTGADARLLANPCAAALPLLKAVDQGLSVTLAITQSGRPNLVLDVNHVG